jgi:GAF domain-containing protein
MTTEFDEREWELDRAEFLAHHSVDTGPLAGQFAELTRALLSAQTVAGALEQVVHAALAVLPGADFVSVTLRSPDGTFHTPVATHQIAVELDLVQYETDEGPCVACAEPTGPALAYSADLADDGKWPKWGPIALNAGVGSVLATTLLPSARPPRCTGALNVYSWSAHGLDKADHTTALLLATHASLALAHTQAVEYTELQAEQLRKAIDSRDVIGQAKGILMDRRGITADEAFELLRRMSQDLNVKLAELALTLATRHTELDLPPVE